MKKYIDKFKTKSNVDALIGSLAVVTEDISPNKAGKVKIEGEIWLAVSQDDIKVNENAKIVSVDGTKLVVKKNI